MSTILRMCYYLTMKEPTPHIVFLFEAYEAELEKVRQGRAEIRNLQNKNREHQKNLELARQNIAGILQGLIIKEGSLYKVFQKYFGKIDKRYYRICSMMNKYL